MVNVGLVGRVGRVGRQTCDISIKKGEKKEELCLFFFSQH